ncbi:MAG: hypothetical protein Q9159_004712 [Coniocarpon cinnabarinum]
MPPDTNQQVPIRDAVPENIMSSADRRHQHQRRKSLLLAARAERESPVSNATPRHERPGDLVVGHRMNGCVHGANEGVA